MGLPSAGKFFTGLGKRIKSGFSKVGKDIKRDFNKVGRFAEDAGKFIKEETLPDLVNLAKGGLKAVKIAAPILSIIAPEVGVPLSIALNVIDLGGKGFGDGKKAVKIAKLIVKDVKSGNIASALQRSKELKDVGESFAGKVEKGSELVGQFEASMPQ